MACPDFEELVRQGPGGHAAQCEDCAALLEALAEVDSRLTAAYAGISAPPSLAASVRMRIAGQTEWRGPSLVPEILDFVGWAGVLALFAALAPRLLSMIEAALAELS
jgi:hypothetical protein